MTASNEPPQETRVEEVRVLRALLISLPQPGAGRAAVSVQLEPRVPPSPGGYPKVARKSNRLKGDASTGTESGRVSGPQEEAKELPGPAPNRISEACP